MRIKFKTVIIGLLIAAWYHDAKLGMTYKRRYESERKTSERMERLCRLYARVLIDNNIQPTAFEEIAMSEILDS